MAKDIKQLNKLLKKWADKSPELMEDIVTETAYKVEAKAKRYCPTDTGRLRGSITTDAKGLEAEVGTNVEYASYVEYGTSKQKAQPYMTPARQDVENQLDKIIIKGVRGYFKN